MQPQDHAHSARPRAGSHTPRADAPIARQRTCLASDSDSGSDSDSDSGSGSGSGSAHKAPEMRTARSFR